MQPLQILIAVARRRVGSPSGESSGWRFADETVENGLRPDVVLLDEGCR